MNNSTIKDPAFTDTLVAGTTARIQIPDHDVAEIAIGFGRQHSAELSRRASQVSAGYNNSMIGGVTFRRVDPLHAPLKVADERLQSHLEMLCESLRAKY